MKYINTQIVIAGALILLLGAASSCKKETAPTPTEISLSLPSQVSLRYGETQEINLPKDLSSNTGLTFSFDFSQTGEINLGNGSKLSDKLNQAIKFDSEKQSIQINSALLYPNGAQSNDARIPDDYKVTVIAKESHGTVVAKEGFSIRILAGSIAIKGLKNGDELPYSYVLYNDQSTDFEIDPLGIPITGASFHLVKKDGQENIASISGTHIKLSKDAGDPEKKAEKSFELTPELRKDGFPIASTTFRVILIPQIKFLFGQYYPDLNLTIDFSLIHIGLSNGYVSAAPTLYPEKYKSTFELVSIEKDGIAFADSEKLFNVNTQTGAVSVKKSDSLKAGSYKVTIKALTTTGLAFTTNLTLAMAEE
ncbi:hypothetical protein [Sphingobacterium prati]|uniref:hypothetical protein n=1 Tax=Sphingobacterium prati TaxID=2737006 RepID=UPI0015554A0A|nr:hypothetical protein [Sphingobacterium prati]NPE44939.1 hypothetical protein [Sphingobacterium prati]